MTEAEQKGYDAFLELAIAMNCGPSATQCPARYMKPSEDRDAYLRGWVRAKREWETVK